MSYQVIVFSQDPIRGGILKKIHQDNKIRTLFVGRIIDIKTAIASYSPRIIILDIYQSLKIEEAFLKSISHYVKDSFIFFLGDTPTLELFRDGNDSKTIFFPEPMTPEKITEKSQEILSLKIQTYEKQKPNEKIIENDLKQFLKL